MAKDGKHFRFRKLEYWAQSGMICVQDDRYESSDPRSFEIVMVREMLYRIRAINAEIHLIKYRDEREEHHKLVDNMIKCCRQAQRQGRPDDPKAVADMLKSRRRSWVMGVSRNGQVQTGVTHVLGSASAPESVLLPPVPNHPELMTNASRISVLGTN